MLKIGSNSIGGMFLGSDEIVMAYIGSDFVYSAEPPDPTLIAYWNGADAAASNNWVDRIGGKRWKIYNTYTRTNGYYQFDNIANRYQFAQLTDNDFGVDYEIKLVFDIELNPDGSNPMIIADLGCTGVPPASHWGIYARSNADSSWSMGVKYNGNNSKTTTATGIFPVLPTETWTSCVVELGIEHDETTDKQRAYMKVGDGLITCDWQNKIKILDFQASTNKAALATSCYNPTATTYSRSRIRIKTIKVYNVV